MKITHVSNSFISVKINGSVLACDPWVGTTNDNGWLAYPFYKNGKGILNEIKPNFIYISHLHGDHFDPGTLDKLKNKKTIIIIKHFPNQRLKNKIKKIGFKNIIECKAWKKYKLNEDISICIVPQMSSNSSQIEEQIDYDLDTSILIQSNITKKVFFNNVDNPLSTNDLKTIKKKCKKVLNSNIDIVCFPVGAAGEYPHCFVNVPKKKEKDKIINHSLKDLKAKLNIIKPKNFFPAGGRYIIYGKFSILNKDVAQPTFDKIKDYLKNESYDIYNIEGSSKVFLDNKTFGRSKINKLNKFSYDEQKIINFFKNKKYFYSNDFKNIPIANIDEIYNKSLKNYLNILKKLPVRTSWKVDFLIYKNLTLKSNGLIDKKKSVFLKKYILKNNNHKVNSSNMKNSKLKLHLDYNLFYGLLKRKYIWNTAISGSIILFERKPNIFDPNFTFSINFLGV